MAYLHPLLEDGVIDMDVVEAARPRIGFAAKHHQLAIDHRCGVVLTRAGGATGEPDRPLVRRDVILWVMGEQV